MMSTKQQKSLLIFDLDGTLIDSVPDLADAVNSMLTQLNKPTFSQDIIRHWVGNGSRKLIERALLGKTDVEQDELSPDEIEQAEKLFFAAYANTSGSKTEAYAGVDEGLQQLHQSGFALALVTNKPQQFIPAILQHFAWDTLFSLIIGGDTLPSRKPDPTPLLHVCQTLGISPEKAIMIGDSKNDILAGKNANIDTLGLTYGYNYGQAIQDFNPTAAFDAFDDLVAYILANND